jgi:hypothetical protein
MNRINADEMETDLFRGEGISFRNTLIKLEIVGRADEICRSLKWMPWSSGRRSS